MELYKKVKKTSENIEGLEICEKNPFIEGPCLLCIAAVPEKKSVFGLTREGMEAARIRTSNATASGFDIENNPVTFLALPNPTNRDNIKSLVDNYLEPLISRNNKPLEIDTAKRNIRNVNIMTYCDGATTYLLMESYLKDIMQEIGYSIQEITEILNEIAFVPIGTSDPVIEYNNREIHIYDMLATTFQFLDIMDLELFDETFPERISKLTLKPIQNIDQDYYELANIIKENNPYPHLIEERNNHAVHTYLGNGKHNLKEYIDESKVIGATISKTITSCLKNSIENKENDEFEGINYKKINEDNKKIIEGYKQGKELEDIFSEIDTELYYPGCKKYSKNEALNLTNNEKYNEKIHKQIELTISQIYYNKSNIENTLVSIKKLLENIKMILEDYSDVLKDFDIPQIDIKINIDTNKEQSENVKKIFNSRSREEELKALEEQNTKLNNLYSILNRTLNELIYERLFKCRNYNYDKVSQIMKKSRLNQYTIPEKSEIEKGGYKL